MDAKKAQKLRDILMVTGAAVMLLGGPLWDPLFICGLMVILSCLIPDFLYNKCPHCGKRLGRYYPNHCPHCGEKLDK